MRKTIVRIKVLREFLESDKAHSLGTLKDRFKAIDRITLYRTLLAFEERGIIHQAIDGSGTTKYAICLDSCSEHQYYDQHAHFHCTTCGKTLCLKEVEVPKIKNPTNYQIEQSHLVLIGLCEECQ
ncbi:MAG: transcriptional repressor [Bacteroidota bacterium]